MRSTPGWGRRQTITKVLALGWVVWLGGLLTVGPAQAHAEYQRSEPSADAILAAPPERIDVWFTQELFRRQGENGLQVRGPDGQILAAGEPQIDDDDRTHLWVVLPAGLTPGVYTVEWRTLSAEDGDTDEGQFTFTVDPQAAVTPSPAPLSPATPTVAATPAPPSPAPGFSLCGVGLAPLAGLVILAQRRRPRR
ncbi:MAG: copper resistance protein CopC [Anaerolineales bacterium]|nr:copper resistance protein CopC [Anaerolineales bacterium]